MPLEKRPKKSLRTAQLPPETISEDPDRFQSRAEYPRDVTDDDEFEGINVFVPSDFVSVWEDPSDQKLYVVDGHRRLRLARNLGVMQIAVQFLDEPCDAEAFACGVRINLAKWAFERGDKLLWAIASRRAAVEQSLHTGWLDVNGYWARQLYRYYYPDLGRRYSAQPEADWEDENN